MRTVQEEEPGKILLGMGEPHGSFEGVPTAKAVVLLPGGEQPISPAKFGGLPTLAPSLLPGIVGKYLLYGIGIGVSDASVKSVGFRVSRV